MSKEMLINVSEGEECRIALVEDGKLQELYMERTSSTSHVGNIYKGRVTNVEPSIQAAFVDFGLGRNGFLHISDLMPSYFGESGEEITESVGRKMSRRDRPPIQRCLRRGDEILVQIIKEGIGTKGPTLSTYVSIPGRILVMMPGMAKFGISRKIEDEDERKRLRGILDSLKPIDDVGFIIRTAGVGKSKTEIDRDLKYLTRLWETITKKLKEPAPIELYTEGDLVTRTVRDVFTSDVEKIVVDSKDVAKKIKEFFKISMPRTKNKVEVYEETVPLFHKYEIEHELEQMYSRHVPLPSGGSLVIDSTEAVVAIDVNSGKFREHNDAEKTAFMTDMEAADEIPRQLKLRDLGGVIICDFIDLRFDRNRRELEKRLHDNLKNDRAKTKVLRMSQFGIIEMTRQRMRPSLKRSIYSDCPHCKGSGLVKTPESMALDLMRKLAIAVSDERVQRVELTVCTDVALHLLNKKRAQLAELESETEKKILILQDASLGLDDHRLQLFDNRDGLVFIDALGMDPHHGLSPHVVRQGERGGGGRRGGRRGRGRPLPEHRNEPNDRGGPIDEAEDREDRRDDDSEAMATPHPRSRGEESDDDEIGEAPQDLPEDQPRGRGRGRGRNDRGDRSRGPRRNEPQGVAMGDHGDDEPAPEAEEEEESQVVDVDDGSEPIGDAPRGMGGDNRNDRGYRNDRRDNRGGRNDGGHRNDRNPQGPRNDRNPQGPRNDRNSQGPRSDRPPQGPRNDQGGPQGGFDNRGGEFSDEGGGRRRRRRRGRRGRGRGGDQQNRGPIEGNVLPPPEPEFEEEDFENSDRPAPGNELPPPEPDFEEEDHDVPGPGNEKFPPPRPQNDQAGGKRRRRRGGKRHRERRERQEQKQQYVGLPKDEPELEDQDLAADTEGPDLAPPPTPASTGRPQRTPPRPAAVEEPITPTGTSDKHLVRDDDDAEDAIEPEPLRRPRSYRDLDEVPDDYDE